MNISRKTANYLIILSICFSSLLANMVQFKNNPELGILLNWFYPPFVGIIGLIFYNVFYSERKIRNIYFLILLFLFNTYVGLTFYFGHPLPFGYF
jgi:hypothetical protein